MRSNASIGANATILPGLMIGERAMVGAGAVVTRNVPPDTIVTGNPARIAGYVGTGGKAVDLSTPLAEKGEAGCRPSRVRGVFIHHLPLVPDLRGSLLHSARRADMFRSRSNGTFWFLTFLANTFAGNMPTAAFSNF